MRPPGRPLRPDGRVLVVGGSDGEVLPDTGTPVKGSSTAQTFDPVSGEWSAEASMTIRRWYPSAIGLPDGGILVASRIENLSDPSTHDFLLERFDSGSGAWTTIWPTVRLAPDVETTTLATSGSGDDRREHGLMNLPLYPRLFVVPGGPYEGQVFYSTVGTPQRSIVATPLAELADLSTSPPTNTPVSPLGTRAGTPTASCSTRRTTGLAR